MPVTLITFTNQLEAHIVLGRLQAEGIPAYIAFEHHIAVEWWLSLALGGVRIQVPKGYYESALNILEAINNGKYENTLLEEFGLSDPVVCPSCSSKNTASIAWLWKLAIFLGFLTMLHVPYTRHLFKCGSCSAKWIASEQRAYPLYVLVFSVFLIEFVLFALYKIWIIWCKLHCDIPSLYM